MEAKRQRKITKEDKLLADQIRRIREDKGLSQEELSKKLGTNLSYIAYIETYRRGLSLPTLYRIAKILDVSVNSLFTF